ncbi:tetratricopeptide repeat protein [Aquabacterium sp.]|uniref:tetratricopeptide repeat protein n=1 Tax=Aquabacterium sp. TaxID=1872578 RepID=UPI002487DC29|nr:tetratricopeptide repeat protein [Aquabacterium sp.]MDI1260218.1 tetratricopeptide repeat protein [Aquabacterium sp.]
MKYAATFLALLMFGLTSLSNAAEQIVFRDKQGRVLTEADLSSLSGDVKWEIRGNKSVPQEASKLHELGRIAGQKGDSKKAIEYFEKASAAAPDWPYPLYDSAFTYLLGEQYSKAYQLYQRVDKMAPRGYFTTKTAVHTLERESRGDLPKGTYLRYVSLEWVNDESQKRQFVAALTERIPNFAPGWKERAQFEDDPQLRLSALNKGLAARPDEETKGYLLVNKAIVLHQQGKREDAVSILGTLALDPHAPVDVELMAKKTLANMLR